MLKVIKLNKSFDISLKRKGFFADFLSFKKSSIKKNILDSISFEINEGKIVALTGINGAGKTTLLRILAKTLKEDSGEIIFNGKVAVLLGFESFFNDRLTLLENTLMAIKIFNQDENNLTEKANELLKEAQLETFKNDLFYKLSAGMKIRIPFLANINSNADLYLIDEIITVGDENFQKKCIEKIINLKKEKKIIIFATHNKNLLNGFADIELRLNNNKIEFYKLS